MLVTTVFGERLKELRDSRRLTQDVLASQVGVSRQTISNWETGTSAPNAVDLPLLAQALGVTVARLYGDEPATIRPAGIGSEDRLGLNVVGRTDELRTPGVQPLPVYRWGSLGDPRDRESAPYPDRMDYPPLGRERLVGPNGFGVDVKGDSMEGRGIRDGDTCWVNPDKPYRLGDVVLASVDAEGESGMVVKTYAHTDVGDCLMSDGASGKSTVICEQFRIIGPVVLVSPRPFPPR